MVRSKALSLLFIIGLFVIACDDGNENELSGTKTTYVLFSPSIDQGLIFTYDYTSQKLNPRHYLAQTLSSGSGRFADVVMDDKYAYCINTQGNILSKVNVEKFALEKSRIISIDPRDTRGDMIHFYNGKIFWTGDANSLSSDTFGWFIKTYDKELNLMDSIGIPNILFAFDVMIKNDIMFLCVNKEGKRSILTFDVNNRRFKKEFETTACDFVDAETHEIFAVGNGTVSILNPIDVSLTKPTLQSIPPVACNDESTENAVFGPGPGRTLFYFTTNPQPATFPYSLQAYDFATDSAIDIGGDTFYGTNAPIVYDDVNDVLVTLAKNKLIILDRDGKKVSEFGVPAESVTHLSIRYE